MEILTATKKAKKFLQSGQFEEAEQIFHKLCSNYPNQPQGFIGLAQAAQQRQDWKAALAKWKKVIIQFPEKVNAHIQYGHVLREMGHLKEAEEVFRKLAEQHPESSMPQAGLARIAHAGHEHEQACTYWEAATECAPENLRLRVDHIHALLDALKFERAQDLYKTALENSQDPALRSVQADIHIARFNADAALEVLHCLRESAPDNLHLQLKQAEILIKCALGFGRTPKHLDQGIACLEQIVQNFSSNLKPQLDLAIAYIHANKNDSACRIIENLPSTYDKNYRIMKLRAWRHHKKSDENNAKLLWHKILQQHFIAAVHGPLGTLERIDSNLLHIDPDEILLFSTMYNELWRLPWFFNYYRSLGVGRFFIIDNNSNDGTKEFLLRQKDVHLFWTPDHYGKHTSGMRWINELRERYGQKNWCLFVDADEALIFPGIELFGLRRVVEYMEQNGHEALFAFMLDMHAYNVQQIFEYSQGRDFISCYPYFNNSYHFYGNINCSYIHVTGGIRRMFGWTGTHQKVPLIHGGGDIKYLSSHTTTPATISDITAVLLHFKMAGGLDKQFIAESTFRNRQPHCQRRHLDYGKTLQGLDENRALTNNLTERYQSSLQLVRLGLIQCPKNFLDIG